jgi:hypothetical protein
MGTELEELRLQWEALAAADTLDSFPKEALIASIKDLAGALLERTGASTPSNEGQPQTFIGERGATILNKRKPVVTYKDVYNAFLVGVNRAAGIHDDTDPYVANLEDIDIIAAAQNMCCVLEKIEGIYPNIPSNPEYQMNSVYTAAEDLAEAIRLTVEYVGNDMLPAQAGWSWFDALNRYNPDMVRLFVEKPIRLGGHVDVVTEHWLFTGHNQPETLSEVIFQGVGAGSACWDNLSGAGIFESDRAKIIADEMVAWVKANYIPKPLVTDDYGVVNG